MRWPPRNAPAARRPPAGQLLFLFKSTDKPGLNAFAGADDPARLPATHGPWVLSGNIPAGQALPHGLSRRAAEEAIKTQGFALWRLKAKPAA